MRMFKTIQNLPYLVAAAATVSIMNPRDAEAATANDLGGIADNVKEQMGSIGQLIVAGAVVGGLVMLATGLMKLKQAADTQGQQVKYGEGMWRVAVGAGMIAIPALSGVLSTSFGLGENVSITQGGGETF